MKLRFGKLKIETIVGGIFILTFILKVFPQIQMYISQVTYSEPVMESGFSINIVYCIATFVNLAFTTMYIWLWCEVLYLILKALQSIINNNKMEE